VTGQTKPQTSLVFLVLAFADVYCQKSQALIAITNIAFQKFHLIGIEKLLCENAARASTVHYFRFRADAADLRLTEWRGKWQASALVSGVGSIWIYRLYSLTASSIMHGRDRTTTLS